MSDNFNNAFLILVSSFVVFILSISTQNVQFNLTDQF